MFFLPLKERPFSSQVQCKNCRNIIKGNTFIQLAPESSHPAAGIWMYGALIKLSPLKSGTVVSFGSTKVTVVLNKKVFVHRVTAEMAWKKII